VEPSKTTTGCGGAPAQCPARTLLARIIPPRERPRRLRRGKGDHDAKPNRDALLAAPALVLAWAASSGCSGLAALDTRPSTEATMHPLQTSVVRTTWGRSWHGVRVLACTRFACVCYARAGARDGG